MSILKTISMVIFTMLISSFAVMAQQTVQVKKYADLSFARTLQFPAKVVNLQLTTISAETNGRILRFPARVGDSVKKGQSIIQLNCRTAELNRNRLQAGLKRLQAQRQLTVQQLERAQRLSSSRSISREELDQRQTQLDADDASIEEQQTLLDSAKQDIEYCQIKAPFSGTIIEKMSNKGAYANPGSPMFKLLKEDDLEIELEMPQNQVTVLSTSEEMTFTSAEQNYPIKLRKIIPWVNPATHQQPIRFSLNGKSFPPGSSRGLVSLKTPKHFLPANLIQKRQGQFGVFIYRDNLAIFKKLDNAQEGQAVKALLEADTLIITSPLQLLSDGQSVNKER